MEDSKDGITVDMPIEEYQKAIQHAIYKGVKQINILGGEPFLHSALPEFCRYNKAFGLKTTIYTNGTFLNRWDNLHGAKIRVSIYGLDGDKGMTNLSGHISDEKVYPDQTLSHFHLPL